MAIEFHPVSSTDKALNVFRDDVYIGSIVWRDQARFDTTTKTLTLEDMKQLVSKLEEVLRV